ncbi:hypothetical protein [Aquicella lusitana]|uniref:Uncharacterized protein n=1 Tax=Aquicella lusitana TaxID=254246 RepID=A0A370GXS7_9COXI|nr:hypothetical protein [Aquicella lusitana]RDI48076.1 hypothetical protein C8D86_10341 [Aquicella lusitana]VVC72908.1 hypothetical protein AQULUS_06320 [Aquicella lusitana]
MDKNVLSKYACLLKFSVLALFITISTNAHAEYYMVYPAAPVYAVPVYPVPMPCTYGCAFMAPCYYQVEIRSSAPYRHSDKRGVGQVNIYEWDEDP